MVFQVQSIIEIEVLGISVDDKNLCNIKITITTEDLVSHFNGGGNYIISYFLLALIFWVVMILTSIGCLSRGRKKYSWLLFGRVLLMWSDGVVVNWRGV